MALALMSASKNGPVAIGSSNSIVVDALPYIDSEYDEAGMKEMVQAMIEEEKRRYRPTKNYLEHLPALELHKFETDVMKKEFERLAQRIPMEVLSMKRYELPPPPAGKLTDLSAWSECVDNSYAQLEHQSTRITNLELMLDYSCEAWKSYLEILTRMVTQSQKQLADLKRQIQEINWQRKSSQTNAGEQLKLLESSWVGLVSKNYEIERACLHLEARIAEKEAERARAAAMAVDHTPLEEILERQHPKYIPSPPPSLSEEPESMSTSEQYRTEQDSPPEPPPQEMNNSVELEPMEQDNDEDDDEEIGPQPSQ
ncbi:Pre-mRNA-splicing factor SPF27 [Orchesella cincta]|uniref:Pre-mRNA-splicing factor SPF27 n=1 Tax=Orchesella cincta TaxID=48709 RepID=A0A1D2NJ85_ORCCI|nr:Pre-mRNA-splicing factor SPF27 [Orchesella cincta]